MTTIKKFEEIPIEKLRWICPLEYLLLKTSDEIEPLKEIIGQDRAVEAIKVGLAIESEGYNIFVTGLSGADRLPTIQQLLEQTKKNDVAPPPDICCVYNFKDPDSPRIINLSAGKGVSLKKDMGEFIESLEKNIPQIFESEEYKSRKKSITENFREKQKAMIKDFEKKITSENFTIVQVQMGPFTRPAILPIVMGNPMPLEQIEALVEKGEYPRETFERMSQKHGEFTSEMEIIFTELQKREKDFEEKMKALDKELVLPLLNESVELIKQKYPHEKLHLYLSELIQNILSNFALFLPRHEKETPLPAPTPPELFTEYQVNVLVDNSETKGIPIIIEKNPNYRNLFGGIEKILDPRYGVWRTDFSRIKVGSLLKANGGYLVMNLLDAAMEPGVWPTLKRVLKNRSVEVQSFDPLYLFTMSTLKPEPIELNVKVILLGDSYLYYLLNTFDDDVKDIFK